MIKIRIKKSLNEAMIILETRRARNWIAQQHPFFRKDFLRAYNAGVTNIPDLAFLKPPGAQEVLDDAKQAYEWPDFNITDPKHLAFIEKHGGMDKYKAKAERFLWRELRKANGLREDEPTLRRGFRDFQALETFYNPKVRNVLASNDVKQLKDFEEATLTSGQDFGDFMNQMKSAFIDNPDPQIDSTQQPDISKAEPNPEGFKTIGNVGDFELIDPSTGRGSAHCAVGTEWCTRNASTYNTYTEGSLRLYYIFNDNLEYPWNKVALGIKDGEIQYGGYGETAVVANDQGIESREELEEIFGGDTDEIINKLTAYYSSDTDIRKEQFVNYLVFVKKSKKLPTAARLQYYDDFLYQIQMNYESVPYIHAFKNQSHIIRIVNKIVNDKEMDKTEYYPELKEKIRERISEIILNNDFGGKLSINEIEKFYDLILSIAEEEDLGALYIFQSLDEKIYEQGRNYNEIPEEIRSKMLNLAISANEEINSHIYKLKKRIELETDENKISNLERQIAMNQYDKRASAEGTQRYGTEGGNLWEGAITEGGNVFTGQTDSIPLEFIQPTLAAYYEELGRLFPVYVAEFDTFKPLGSVGKKARSGDIDLAVDVQELFPDGEVNPEDIAQWGLDPEAWKQRVEKLTKRARTSTLSQLGWKAFLQLLAAHINENSDLLTVDTKKIGPGKMFSLFPQFNEQGEIQIIKNEQGEDQIIGVQIDWMVGNIDWLTFSYFSDAPSDDEPLLKGLHRTQLIHALILAKNHSFSHTDGVTNKKTGEIVAFSKEEILDLLGELYRNTITLEDTLNFNTLYNWIKGLDENDRNQALRAYLIILDRTNGNKDLDGSRCGYIPKALEQIYLSLYEKGALFGKFLCKEANPTLWAAVKDGNQKDAVNEVGMGCGTGDQKGPCPDPKKQSSGTFGVRPLKIGGKRNLPKRPKLEEQAADPSQEFLASLQALVEPFINSDITSARSLNHQFPDSPIKIIGIGSDKIVFSHPDYPEWVFKVVKPNAVKDEAGDEKYVWNTLKDSQFASILAPIIGYDGTPVYAMRKTSSGGSLEDIKDALYKISNDKYKDFEYYLLADANKSNIGLIDGQSVLSDYDQWDYYFRTYGEKLQEQADEKITVVIPGGFKPPHRGHVEMINHFANLPEVGEVIIFTGSKPRMSEDGTVIVTKDKTIELFKLFGLAPNVRFGEVRERPKKDGSTYENPFMDAVGVLFDENFAGKKVAIGHPTKDATYSDRFSKIARSSKNKMFADLVQVEPAVTTGELSATDLRNAVQSGDLEELERFIPAGVTERYLKILVGD
jgi:hypothetical protein